MTLHFLDLFKARRCQELKEIYESLALRKFALTLIGVFVPVYLLQLGYPVSQVILFYLFLFTTVGIVSPLAAQIASKIGFKHTMLIAIPLMIIHLFFLLFLETFPTPLFFIASLAGLAVVTYWIPLNADFARSSDKKHRAEEVAGIHIVTQLASLLGPIAGAMILGSFGFQILFSVVIVLLFLSLVPLFKTKDIKEKVNLDLKIIFARDHAKYLGWFIAEGMIMFGESLLWPLFIYLTLANTLDLGMASSLNGLGAVLFAFTVGRMADLKKRHIRRTLVIFGAISMSFIFLGRYFLHESIPIFILSLLGGLMFALIDIPFFARVNDKANKETALEFMTFREIGLSIGRLSIGVLALLLLPHLEISFLVGTIASLAFLL